MAYGTVDDLKVYLRVSVAGDDALLTDLLDKATKQVDVLAGRTWSSGSATRSYGSEYPHFSPDWRTLFLDAPLTALATLTNGDATVIGSSNYVLLPRNDAHKNAILLKLGGGYLFEFGADDDVAITVAATWVVPDHVEQAAYIIARALYEQGQQAAVPYEDAIRNAKTLLANPFSMGLL